MKKKLVSLFLATAMFVTLCAGCGNEGKTENPGGNGTVDSTNTPSNTPGDNSDNNDNNDDNNDPGQVTPDDPNAGLIRSALTNEWISASYEGLRPIAIMIPNDKSASPHYGLSEAGVIYQCQVEGSMTRLMALFDNLDSLGDRVGNLRSARTYFVYWALEWDPLYVHHGNPWYVDDILNSGLVADLDCNDGDAHKGTEDSFGTVDKNGRACYWYRTTDRKSPHNAYLSKESLENFIEARGYSLNYTGMYKGAHYQFADEENVIDLSTATDAIPCNKLDLTTTYPVDDTYFTYDAESGKYLRFQYNEAHVDEVNGEQLSFENILVQFTPHRVMDTKGYLEFYFKAGGEGYYITNGYAIPVTWAKEDDYAITKYYDANGNEITLNTGKTMICIIEDGDPITIE